jgi:hypothetical protein
MSRLFRPRRLSAVFLVLGALAAVLIPPSPAHAQATATVKGRIMDGNAPGAFANVIILGTSVPTRCASSCPAPSPRTRR